MSEEKPVENPSVALSDLGVRLVIGGEDGRTDLEFDDKWTGEEEEKILKLIKDRNPIEQVAVVLAFFAKKWGGYNFETMPMDRRISVINGWNTPDVLTAWFTLRSFHMGSELASRQQCPHCGSVDEYKSDLDDFEVMTASAEPEAIVNLKRGVFVGGKKNYSVRVAVPRWRDAATWMSDPQTKRLHYISSCCKIQVEGENGIEEYPVAPSMLHKVDIDPLYARAVGLMAEAGVVVGGDLECPSCTKKHTVGVNWSYQAFFTSMLS